MPFLVDLLGISNFAPWPVPIRLFQRARDWYLAQIHPEVDQVLSQSRKTDKIASSDVARSRVDWNTFHTIDLPTAGGEFPRAGRATGEQLCAQNFWQ
jgi:hypothetical protein